MSAVKEPRKVKVFNSSYAFALTKERLPESIICIKDGDDITSVIAEKDIPLNKTLTKETGFRLIKFDMLLPSTLVGFIAEFSKALAEERIPIYSFSSCKTEYILLKEEYLQKALKKLRSIGFQID